MGKRAYKIPVSSPLLYVDLFTANFLSSGFLYGASLDISKYPLWLVEWLLYKIIDNKSQ